MGYCKKNLKSVILAFLLKDYTNIFLGGILMSYPAFYFLVHVLTDHPVHAIPSSDPWAIEVPAAKGYTIKAVNGVFNLFRDPECTQNLDYVYPKLPEFIQDMQTMCAMIADGPLKSFCYRRLSYLYSKFQLHVLLNELRELASQKAVPHRDFYNIRLVILFYYPNKIYFLIHPAKII